MPRVYSVSFLYVAVSAVQDLVSVKGSSGKVCRLNRAWLYINDNTLPAAQALRLNIKYGSATVTLGSGGTAPTPRPLDPGMPAASFTCRVNDTTQATTSGAFVDILPCGGHIYGNFTYNFGTNGPMFGLNTGVVFELLGAPTASTRFSGGLEIEEMG